MAAQIMSTTTTPKGQGEAQHQDSAMNSTRLMEHVDATPLKMRSELREDAENPFDGSGPTTAEIERAVQFIQELHHGKVRG
jgi:hypothetical protein